MMNTRKQIPTRMVAIVNPDFDFIKYHDDAISDIINRFRKTQNMKRMDHRFESDYVFREADAQNIIDSCMKMNLPFEVSYKPCYDGCWEINFKILLEERKVG